MEEIQNVKYKRWLKRFFIRKIFIISLSLSKLFSLLSFKLGSELYWSFVFKTLLLIFVGFFFLFFFWKMLNDFLFFSGKIFLDFFWVILFLKAFFFSFNWSFLASFLIGAFRYPLSSLHQPSSFIFSKINFDNYFLPNFFFKRGVATEAWFFKGSVTWLMVSITRLPIKIS